MESNNDRLSDLENGDDFLDSSGDPNDDGSEFWRSKVNDAQFPLVVVSGASIVLLISVCTWELGMQSYGYAISVPILSLVLSISGLLLTVFREDLYSIYGNNLAQILFMWNFSGACFLTFSSPFTTTGNGYFAAWACVATSAMAMGLTADALRNRTEGIQSLMGLCACAVVVIFALVDYVGSQAADYLRGESIFAMVVSVFTVVLCVGFVYFKKQLVDGDRQMAVVEFAFLAVFAILWFVLAFLVTFRGPFVTTGNGYFASWCGAICACSAAFAAKKQTGITMKMNFASGSSFNNNSSNSNNNNNNNNNTIANPTRLSGTIT